MMIIFSLDGDYIVLWWLLYYDVGLDSISLFNINVDDKKFDYCDRETINYVRLIG